jgi:hypothetical protein
VVLNQAETRDILDLIFDRMPALMHMLRVVQTFALGNDDMCRFGRWKDARCEMRDSEETLRRSRASVLRHHFQGFLDHPLCSCSSLCHRHRPVGTSVDCLLQMSLRIAPRFSSTPLVSIALGHAYLVILVHCHTGF